MKQFDVQQYLEENKHIFTDLSDQIWDIPELNFQEKESCKLTSQALVEAGFTVTQNVAGLETAVMGSYGNGDTVIAFLGEYDALSNLSQKNGEVNFDPIEEDGNGHGCGHNLLGAGSFAAACAVKKYIEETNAPFTVRYYGCPAEENGSGKAIMVAAGAFEDVDLALSWHPNNLNTVMNSRTLAIYAAKFKFRGISSHAAAAPHLGRSALDALELMNIGTNFLREHVIQDARIHYAITNSGGISPNIVQPYAEGSYFVRAPKKKQVKEIFARIQDIAKGAALMTGTTVEEVFEGATSDLIPNTVLATVMDEEMAKLRPIPFTDEDYEFAQEIYDTFDEGTQASAYLTVMPNQREELGNKKLMPMVTPMFPEAIMPASTDVADVSWVTPTVQCVSSTWAIGTPPHTWQVVSQGKMPLAHKGMLFAAAAMAETAIRCIENPNLIEQAKEELAQRLSGEVYETLIPQEV